MQNVFCISCAVSIVAHKYTDHFRVSAAWKSKLAEILPVSIRGENSSQENFISLLRNNLTSVALDIPFSEQ